MVGATGCYVASDTTMKLATAGLPLYETLALRGVFATACGVLLVFVTGQVRAIPGLIDRWVLTRNIDALVNLPIANVIAILQITPLVVLLGARIAFKERLGAAPMVCILLGFSGAVMIAHPTGEGLSSYALLAIGTAFLGGVRDIVGRMVPVRIAGLVVALGASIVVWIGTAAMHLIVERTVVPSLKQVSLLSGSGFFLFGGHYLLFSAYKSGPIAVVAPLYYLVALWAIFAGALFFRTVPDALAIAGMVLVVLTGAAIIVFDPKHKGKRSARVD
jgi:drug/metabolite transporter (DMT)-like permease